MKQKLLDILVCPQCKHALIFDQRKQQMICEIEQLAYPVRDGIPVLLVSEAVKLADQSADTQR